MADIYTKQKRSEIMRCVKQRGTAPEEVIAEILRGMKLRFRQNVEDLPGKPDFVITSCRAVVFVHGCFWHRHAGCSRTTTPASNVEFWKRKFESNLRRDRKNARVLRMEGWRVVTVLECSLRDRGRVLAHLKRFLKPRRKT